MAGVQYHFADSNGIAVDGPDLWITDSDNFGPQKPDLSGATEISANSGDLVRYIPGGSGGLAYPQDIVAAGAYLWAMNLDSSLVELAANSGTVVRKIYPTGHPAGISISNVDKGGDFWVNDFKNNSIIEINAVTGAKAHTLSHFDDPGGITAYGNYLWVANQGNAKNDPGSVTKVVIS